MSGPLPTRDTPVGSNGIDRQPGDPGAAARSHLYLTLAGIFDYPDAAFRDAVASGELVSTLTPLLTELCPELAARAEWFRFTGTAEELATEYSFLFDVGNSGKPPCPLYGGTYPGVDRMKAMEEALRFYNLFGLHLDAANHDMPDHLVTELEFLHFLAHRQADPATDADEAAACRRAERDFIERHPGRWVPLMRDRLDNESSDFYREAVHLLDEWLRHYLASPPV